MKGRLSSYPARCLLAILSGAAYAGAYPPVGRRWLVLPAVVGLLVSLRGEHGSRARALGFLFGMMAFGLGLSWLWSLFGPAAIVLWVVLSAFPALFAHMQGLAGNLDGWKLSCFTALNWCGWEFIRAEVFPLKFPWMTAGLAVGPNALLPWIGVYGVGLLGAFFAATPWRGKSIFASACAMGAVYVVCFLPQVKYPENLIVAAIQLEETTMDRFVEETRALPPHVSHVVWPEYALPYDVRANDKEWRELVDLCRELDITLTLGTQSRDSIDGPWRNIALTLDASGAIGEHNKIHTVHFFADGTPGKEAKAFSTAHGKIGTPICFDCDYEGVIRKMTAAGAERIITPVMDAKSWSVRQHQQHAELFRIRACENRRWIFSCTTSGVSQAIDPSGHVIAGLGAMKEGALVTAIGSGSDLTFYTKYGWLTPWIALGLAVVCWCGLVFRVISEKLRTRRGELQGSVMAQP